MQVQDVSHNILEEVVDVSPQDKPQAHNSGSMKRKQTENDSVVSEDDDYGEADASDKPNSGVQIPKNFAETDSVVDDGVYDFRH